MKYWPLITIIALIVGYSSLSVFYSSFNIEILNYVDTAELLYQLLPTTAIIFIGYAIIVRWLLDGIPNNNEVPAKPRNPWIKWLLVLAPGILGIALVIFDQHYSKRLHAYRFEPFVSLSIILLGAYQLFGYALWQSIKSKTFGINHLVVSFIILGVAMRQYESSYASVIKTLGPETNYSFCWKGNHIKTDKVVFVIGETQSYLFLYNKKDSTTLVYKRNDVDSLAIRKVGN